MFWLVAVFLGFAQTWVMRHSVNSDAVSYLDIGDAYFRGDWEMAINGMWSPLYSFLLGAVLTILQPSYLWEYPLAHFVNFFLYLTALAAFDFYFQEIRRENKAISTLQALNLPEKLFQISAYAIFIWTTPVLIKIKHIVPDLGVATVVFLTAGLIMRIRRNESLHDFALLGSTLGIGFLMKAPVLPLAFVFLLGVAWIIRNSTRKRLKLAVAGGFLVLFAAPFIIALSLDKNKITFSENGKINYAWHVNGVKNIHWQGEKPEDGIPLHPSRKVFDSPAIFEFGTPLRATYPIWYDPSYWYEGITFRFNLVNQLRESLGQVRNDYARLFFLNGIFLAVGFLGLFWFAENKRDFWRNLLSHWFLLLPSLCALLMYLAVHVETRYIAPFIAVILISAVSGINRTVFKHRNFAVIALSAAVLISILPATLEMNAAILHKFFAGEDTGDNDRRIVAEARKFGVLPNDKIASIGRSNVQTALWARLARVRIVAEMPHQKDVSLFWESDEHLKEQVLATFAATGAKYLVAEKIPTAEMKGWQQLEGTEVYLFRLE